MRGENRYKRVMGHRPTSTSISFIGLNQIMVKKRCPLNFRKHIDQCMQVMQCNAFAREHVSTQSY